MLPLPTGRLVRETGVVLAGQVGAVVLGLAALRVITELLDPEVYGSVALLLAGLALGKGLLVAPWLAAQLRMHPEARGDGELPALYGALARITFIGAALATIGISFTLVATGAGPAAASGIVLMAVVGVWLVADAGISAGMNYLNAELRQSMMSAIRLADAFLRPALGVAVVALLVSGAIPFVAGQAVGAMLLAIILGTSTLRRLRAVPRRGSTGLGHKPWLREILHYGIPLVPMAMFQWVIHLSDRYILEFYHGSSEVGLYSAAYGLASQPFLMLSGVATLLFRPRVFGSIEGDLVSARRYRRLWLATLLLVGGVGLALLTVWRVGIARILLAAEYRAMSAIVPIVGAGYLLLAIGQCLENWAMAQKRTRRILVAGVTSLAVSLGTAFLLIPVHGSLGAACSTFLGLSSYVAAMFVAQQLVKSGDPPRGGRAECRGLPD